MVSSPGGKCCYQRGADKSVGWGGGLSDHLVVPEYTLYKIPDNVGLDVAGKHDLSAVD